LFLRLVWFDIDASLTIVSTPSLISSQKRLDPATLDHGRLEALMVRREGNSRAYQESRRAPLVSSLGSRPASFHQSFVECF